jgi:hypothetical protein
LGWTDEVSLNATTPRAKCRFCAAPLTNTFVDLGMSPLCQTHIEPHELNHMERFYPLHAWVCASCYLVQLEEYVSPDQIFSDYAYFSSYSDSWVEHARQYAQKVSQRFALGPQSLVMEIASNDGYLLQHFKARGVPCRGIEPAANVAKVAVEERGIPTTVAFFGRETALRVAAEHGRPNLLLGNNVLAHVPDINDFVAGMQALLAPGGQITMEFPHLVRLMDENQFDTIYHEHFSYLSFGTVQRIFAHHGLRLFDVEQLPTHGGSLRIYACHSDDARVVEPSVARLLADERAFGLLDLSTYREFEARVTATKRRLLEFLIGVKNAGKRVVGYGAPGKGNTLLNYCGIRTDFLDYTVDRSPHKYGRYTPGTHIPILHPDKIRETRPDYVLILPWNLQQEISTGNAYIREWGGRFVVPIPTVRVLD